MIKLVYIHWMAFFIVASINHIRRKIWWKYLSIRWEMKEEVSVYKGTNPVYKREREKSSSWSIVSQATPPCMETKGLVMLKSPNCQGWPEQSDPWIAPIVVGQQICYKLLWVSWRQLVTWPDPSRMYNSLAIFHKIDYYYEMPHAIVHETDSEQSIWTVNTASKSRAAKLLSSSKLSGPLKILLKHAMIMMDSDMVTTSRNNPPSQALIPAYLSSSYRRLWVCEPGNETYYIGLHKHVWPTQKVLANGTCFLCQSKVVQSNPISGSHWTNSATQDGLRRVLLQQTLSILFLVEMCISSWSICGSHFCLPWFLPSQKAVHLWSQPAPPLPAWFLAFCCFKYGKLKVMESWVEVKPWEQAYSSTGHKVSGRNALTFPVCWISPVGDGY